MAKVIAVYNKKGGCGKTTTATTLAYLLARCGKRTALIDLDSQGDSSLAYGVPNPDKLQTTILSLVKQVIIGEPLPSPSSYRLSKCVLCRLRFRRRAGRIGLFGLHPSKGPHGPVACTVTPETHAISPVSGALSQSKYKPITGDCVWKEARAEWESPE